MRAAAVQFKAAKGDWDGSARRLEALLEGVHADLIVCPEMALTGYVFADAEAAGKVAEAANGRTLELASKLARVAGAYFVIGYPEAVEERLYNSALILGPDGALLCNYRKRLLYEADETWAWPGDTPYPWIETPFGSLTCGICMDMNDDEFIGFLLDREPAVIAFPTNWLDQGFDVRYYWRWRLSGYRGTLVAANTYGTEEGIRFRGRSAILRCPGKTLALAGETGDAVIVGEESVRT